MKKTVLRILLFILMVVASGSTPVLGDAGGWPVPICYPTPCAQ